MDRSPIAGDDDTEKIGAAEEEAGEAAKESDAEDGEVPKEIEEKFGEYHVDGAVKVCFGVPSICGLETSFRE